MKNDGKLAVGAKGLTKVVVPVREAENIEDLSNLAKGNVEVITRWANRGFRIESQERSGAREKLRELRAANTDEAEVVRQISELVANYDPTQKAARGGPRGPKQVTIKTGKGGKIDAASFVEQLKAAGINVNFQQAEEALATAGAGAGAQG
jgi:hypothetical protein